MKKEICCICGKPIEGFGNNPDGALWRTEEGDIEGRDFKPNERCCDECNMKYVIPGRMYRLRHGTKGTDQKS